MKQNKTAILYDAENIIQDNNIHRIIDCVKNETTKDTIIFNGAYADWGLQKNDQREIFINNGIALKQSISYQKVNDTFKNASDISLCIDAIEVILKHKDLNKLVIVSGDGGFINLIVKAKEYGIYVVVVSLSSKLNKNVSQYANKVVIGDHNYSNFEKFIYFTCKNNMDLSAEGILEKILVNKFTKMQIENNQFIVNKVFESISKALNIKIATQIIDLIYSNYLLETIYQVIKINGNDTLVRKH